MEHGAFRSPLSEFGLSELGRATYNWGMADMLAEQLLGTICGTELRRDLIMPLMIEKKAQILKRNLDKFPKGECRKLVESFVKDVIRLNGGRNHAIHGFWGWEAVKNRGLKSAAHSYKSDSPLYAEDISAIADGVAVATRKAYQATLILSGAKIEVNLPVNFYFGAGDPSEMLPPEHGGKPQTPNQ